jgi:translation initiation factor 1 (eIF-1/SUI1)
MMQSSNEITSPFHLLQNVVQQKEDGHISIDEQIKTGQSNTTTVHTSDVAETNVKSVAKSWENDDDVHKNVQSGT